MPDNIHHGQTSHSEDKPLNLDMVRDELGRLPVLGPASDGELFFDLPAGGFATGSFGAPPVAGCQTPVEREFLSNDFAI